MNNVLFRVTSLFAGLLFGLGMVISGMADPAKVVGFLDVAGDWDPSLMFVMGGALMVFMPAYFFLIKPKSKPVNAEKFCVCDQSISGFTPDKWGGDFRYWLGVSWYLPGTGLIKPCAG